MPPLLLFALLFVPQDKPPERCVVSGTVVDSVTERPVAKVEIELRPTERAANHIAFTRTDADGRFTMVDVDAGSYRLVGTRAGYLESFYGARRSESSGAVVRLAAGQKLDSIKLKIVPVAVISGRVLDPEGDPIGHAHLVLSERRAENGRLGIHGSASVDADEQGFFRLGELHPGRYYVLAEGPSFGWDRVDHSPASDKPREALIPTLYPGVPALTSAAPLEIRPGDRREGIEIRLLRSRVFRVTGRVVGLPQRTNLTLRPIAIDFIHDMNQRATTINGSGEFDFRDVAPGAYWIDVAHSLTRVDVGFADVEGVRVTLGQTAQVQIAITAEGPEPPKNLASTIFITYDGRSGSLFETDEAGRATRATPPGAYEVHVFRVPNGYYVKSVRSGGHEVERVEIPSAGSIPIEIVIAGDGGTVEGAVAEASGGVIVVLIPENRAGADRYKTVTTDQYGHFSVANVPPGTYKAFAWDDVKEDDWFDPEFLKLYERQGVEFKLDARGTKSLDLKIARDK